MFGSRKLLKGSLDEKPWAATLATIAASADSCQLTIKSEGKVYQVAFIKGAVVGAVSPAPADNVQRIALTNHVVPPGSVAAAVRIMGRIDDVEKFADASGLVGDGGTAFKKRVLLQRAARTFGLEKGDFVVDEKITIKTISSANVDVRAVIYHGMRLHLSDLRLATQHKAHGGRFILYPEAAPFLEKFELGPDTEPIIAALRGSTSAPEIEALHRDLDPRMVHAVLGALATCNVISAIEPRAPQDISLGRTPTPRQPTVTRIPTPRDLEATSKYPVVLARGTREDIRDESGRHSAVQFETQTTTARPSPLSTSQIRQLIASRLAMLEVGVDLFSFLGLPFNAPAAQVRDAYLEIARYVHPDRLPDYGIRDDDDEARAVYAQAVIALTTLTDQSRRVQYITSFRRNTAASRLRS